MRAKAAFKTLQLKLQSCLYASGDNRQKLFSVYDKEMLAVTVQTHRWNLVENVMNKNLRKYTYFIWNCLDELKKNRAVPNKGFGEKKAL